MIQQRPTESEEDYKKRKRRVQLSMMGGLANGGGSLILAAIIYNMDTFNLDVDVRTIDNAGSESSSADAPMYASNHIFLDGSTQDVTYTTVSGSDYGYFDVATKSHVKVTASAATATITDSHSNFFSLKGGASLTELDLSLLNLKPESIARLVDGETVSELSFDLTDIESFYPGNEGEASGAYVQNVMVDLGSELVTNSDFSTSDLTGWTFNSCSGVVIGGRLEVTSTATTALATYILGTVNGNTYRFSFEVEAGTHVGYNYSVYDIENSSEIIVPTAYDPTLGTVSVEFTATGNSTAVYVLRTGTTTLGTSYFDNVSVRETTSSEILNYASTCRTNLDLTNYGASNLLYKQDETGRFTGMADANLIEFTGDGRYADTGFVPNVNFILEVVINWDGGYSDFVFGCGNNDGIMLVNGISVGNHLRLYARSNSNWEIAELSGIRTGIHFYSIKFINGTGTTINEDNTVSTSKIFATSLDATNNLKLGVYLSSDNCVSAIGKFKIIKDQSQIDNYDDATAYAQAKLIYPTLP